MILKLWQMMKRTTRSKRTWTICISLNKKKKYCHSFDTLTSSVWAGLVLVRNDLEALADDDDDLDEREVQVLEHVHFLKQKEKSLPFLCYIDMLCLGWLSIDPQE
jgi:hypothetical protein